MSNIDIELYTQKSEIATSEPDITIEISNLVCLTKFIGLEDTPIYYENGKFFKVEDNKIIYTDIKWEDIKGQVDDNPELKAEVERLVEDSARKFTEQVVSEAIDIHDSNQDAHPYIQNIIQENYETLNNKIDLNKIDTDTNFTEINNKIQTNITNIDNLNTYTQELNTKIDNLVLEVDIDIKGDIQKLQDDLQITNQEIVDNFNTLDKKIDDNYTTLNTKIDNSVNTLNTTIDNTKTEINKTITDLESKVDQNKVDHDKDIQDLNKSIQDLDDKKADKANTLEGYGITNAYTKSEIDSKVASVYKVKGSVDTYNDLPIENIVGDVYNVLDTGSNYVWTENGWDKLSETIDLSPYLLKSEADQIYETIKNVEAIKELLELGVDTLKEDVDKNTVDISNLTTTITNNKSELDTKISDLDAKVDTNKTNTDKSISDLNTKVNDIKTDIETAIKAETDRAKLVEAGLQDDINDLDTRIIMNETNITNLQNSKQNNLTAGEGIDITNDTISNKLSIIFRDWSIS